MSRVIRTAVWQEAPRVIDVPAPEQNTAPEETDEEQGPKFDEEAQQRMLAEIAEKEQRADRKLKEAEAEADALRETAENEKKELLQAAQQEIEQLKTEARESGQKEGHEEGYEKGMEEARAEMKEVILDANKRAEHTLQTAREAADYYMQHAEEDVAKIVMRVVEKVIPQHFIDVPQVILPAVRQAILKVRDQKEVNVHVPPDSYDIVLMARDEFRTILTDGTAVLEITSDESLKPGDCVIETPNGGVDARLQTQIELIRQAVQGVLS